MYEEELGLVLQQHLVVQLRRLLEHVLVKLVLQNTHRVCFILSGQFSQ